MNAPLSALLNTVGWRLAQFATRLQGVNFRVAPEDDELRVGARPNAPDGRKLALQGRSKDAPKPQTITLLLTIEQGELLMLAILRADKAVHDAEDPGDVAVEAQG